MVDYDRPDTYRHWSVQKSVYSPLEWYVFLETLGSVDGLNVLDVACGDGRLSRVLMERGARSVVGTDIASAMIARAEEHNRAASDRRFAALSYRVVDARDDSFRLARPVDLVSAMYLFHYASSEHDLARMCRFIGRNLKPGGRFVTYTLNPGCDFANQHPRMEEVFGFRYQIVAPPEYALVIRDFKARIWQWSRSAHERALRDAGLTDIRWHPLQLPAEQQDLAPSVQWYLDNPSCIVLSAERAPTS